MPPVRPYESMIIFDAELEEPAIAASARPAHRARPLGWWESGIRSTGGESGRSPTRCGTVARVTTS